MIFVFKTSVKTSTQAKKLKQSIDSLLPNASWNFDLTDCDKILRINSEENVVLKITELLQAHNHHCEEIE